MQEEDKTFENEVKKEEPNHGGKRPGAGRPFGAKTKKLWKSMEEMAVKYQHSPLDYLLSVLNNPTVGPAYLVICPPCLIFFLVIHFLVLPIATVVLLPSLNPLSPDTLFFLFTILISI